jgi:hypothetical protein
LLQLRREVHSGPSLQTSFLHPVSRRRRRAISGFPGGRNFDSGCHMDSHQRHHARHSSRRGS